MIELFGFVIGIIVCAYFIVAGIILILTISGFVGRYKVEEVVVITMIEIIGIGGMIYLLNNAPFSIHMN
jgi:hypothetical protein